ncbi:pyridoxal phosphate-dependent aminotransferase [Candidatus Methylomicrobium oryzae]|uniref:pyridoxal phosphate-dependent aminotransferase n=1 Tax=Candidatus Methylomicrobium oryzae TaxID=2802053 RepID=UPI001921FAD1|nr:pyridoxal phosphate-dependent aminotransferase [Methylomicrobium sp. RS1]MBL1262322.1 pyridoxal phosphate-dependent aminotransferase [Methylomicrobium sp. RS1]
MSLRVAERISGIQPFYVMELLRRAKELEADGRDVIHMEIGEPDFTTPKTILKAALAHTATGDVKYTPAAGLTQLRQKIAAFYRRSYGVDIPEQRVFVTPGATGAFLLALGASLNPGEEVLMADPCYPCNSNFVQLYDGKTRTVPVDADSHYQLTAELIERHWSAATKGALIASPSNPTGTLIPRAELQKAIEATQSLGGCFYSDEIYHGLIYGEKAATALEFSGDVFVINSFSKYFGMTGWRIGWLIVPEMFIEAAEKLSQNIFISTSSDAQHAALAAFDESTLAELEGRRREFEKRRDFLYDALVRLGFEIPIKPEGAFYIYARCAKFTDDSFQFALDLLENEGVAVTPGKDFGLHEAHHALRFAYTTSLDRLAEAVRRLERFLNTR